MVLIIISWLFNGFLVGLIYLLGILLLYRGGHHPYYWLMFGYVTVTILMFIGASKIGTYLLRLYFGYRPAIDRERQKLNPLLIEILTQINQKFSTTYTADNIKILIAESMIPDSQAFGDKAILLTNGLLTHTSDEELKSLLAHELGHLYYKDSIRLNILVFSNLATLIINSLYNICMRIIGLCSGMNKPANKVLYHGNLLAYIPFIIFLPILALNWFFNQFFKLSLLLIYRQYEYRADKFAKDLGYKEGLISFLKSKHIITPTDNSLLSRIFATHPSAIKRIDLLDRI